MTCFYEELVNSLNCSSLTVGLGFLTVACEVPSDSLLTLMGNCKIHFG